MSKILVSGLINLETTLRIDEFPLAYYPVRYPFFGVNSTISGVGFNIAKSLTALGDPVTLLSLIGRDFPGRLAHQELVDSNLETRFVLDRVNQTAQSVILYDAQGRRQIHVDLKDIQDQNYPLELSSEAIKDCDLAVLCNVNFSRSLLPLVRETGKLIATDIHAIASLEDPYNHAFMESADILFMSHERLPVSARDWAIQVFDRFPVEILVIGMGDRGALMAVRQDRFLEAFPAVNVRPVVNTIGAGDALFSGFLHVYLKTRDPYEAIHKAIVLAAYKIGETGAASGFLSDGELGLLAEKFN